MNERRKILRPVAAGAGHWDRLLLFANSDTTERFEALCPAVAQPHDAMYVEVPAGWSLILTENLGPDVGAAVHLSGVSPPPVNNDDVMLLVVGPGAVKLSKLHALMRLLEVATEPDVRPDDVEMMRAAMRVLSHRPIPVPPVHPFFREFLARDDDCQP